MTKRSQRKKYPGRPIVSVTDSKIREALYQATDPVAPLDGRKVAAGIIQHPDSGFHQVWLSTNGYDVTSLSANRDKTRAEAALSALKTLLGSPDVRNGDRVDALFARLLQESDEKPRPLPDTQVRAICREILRNVVDHP